MIKKVLALTLLLSSAVVFGQTVPKKTPTPNQTKNTISFVDAELQQHLSAAETYQLTNDVYRAAGENSIVAALGLRQMGLVAIDEEDYKKAAEYLQKSSALYENALTKATLAVAYMRLGENEKAIAEAQGALALDAKNVQAYQILSSVYYSQGDYQQALPTLEKLLQLAPDFDGAYLLGVTYLNLKQTERAKLLFEEIENAVKTKNSSLYLLFGRAYEETDHPQEAEREYKKAIALAPKEAKGHFYLGFVIMQNGGSERLPEAAEAFRKALLLDPKDFHTNFFLGVVYSSLNEHQKAIESLQQAIALNPKISQSYLFLGQSQLELGDALNAEKNLRRAIALDTDAKRNDFQIRRAHFLLGRLLLKAGKKEEAARELETAQKLQGQMFERDRDEIKKVLGEVAATKSDGDAPQTPAKLTADKEKKTLSATAAAQYAAAKKQLAEILAQAFHNLGVISFQQGNLADSLEKFAAAAEWKPDFPGLDRNWGIVSFRANEFGKAVAPLARHLKANPNDELVRRMLGVSLYFTKDFKQAVAALKPIELKLIDDAELSYFYGISLAQSQLNKDAEAHFARLAEKNPADAQARFYAAQGFAITGDYERAVREFAAVAALAPRMERVHYNAGQALIRLNRLGPAEKEFRQELAINPADELSKYHLAFTLLEQKINADEAVSLLNEAIALKPDYAEAHYQLGKILIERGDTDQAIEHLETAARSEPKTDYIRYQLSIAYRKASRLADADRELKTYRDLKAASRQTNSPMGND